MLNVVILSFQKWNGLDPHRQFVGLANYTAIFTRDPVFWVAFRNTVVWTVMSLIFPPMVGLLLASVSIRKIFGRNSLQGHLLSAGHHRADRCRHHVEMDVRSVLRPFQSVARRRGACRAGSEDWLGNKDIALYSVFLAYLWQTVGFSMVLFLAGPAECLHKRL